MSISARPDRNNSFIFGTGKLFTCVGSHENSASILQRVEDEAYIYVSTLFFYISPPESKINTEISEMKTRQTGLVISEIWNHYLMMRKV